MQNAIEEEITGVFEIIFEAVAQVKRVVLS
jgi:hypothetical protein